MACQRHSLAACQRYTPSSLAAVIGRCRLQLVGLSDNHVISLRPLRQFRYVPYFPYVALDGNPALNANANTNV